MLTPPVIHDLTDLQPFINNYKGRLTEGLTINRNNNTLLWLDIIAGEIHRVTLHCNKINRTYSNHETYKVEGESIGAIHLTTDDDVILVGARYGIASYQFTTRQFEYLWRFDHLESITDGEPYKLRCNDGNLDPQGNIWQGLMFDFPYEPHKQGKLVKIDTKTGEISIQCRDIFVPNGINWSKDGERLYWTTTRDDKIYKFPFDGSTSTKGEGQIHIETLPWFRNEQSKGPDGHALTENEHIFTAIWGGSTVAHFDNEGKLVEKFKLPALNITDVLFVEEDEVFVTCANKLPEDENVVDETLGGSVFRFVIDGGFKGVDRPYLQWPLKETW